MGDAVGTECGLGAGHVGALARFALDDARGNTDRRGTCGNGFDHHRVAADLGAVAHLKAAQNFGPGANDHVFAQSGVALGPFVERGAA